MYQQNIYALQVMLAAYTLFVYWVDKLEARYCILRKKVIPFHIPFLPKYGHPASIIFIHCFELALLTVLPWVQYLICNMKLSCDPTKCSTTHCSSLHCPYSLFTYFITDNYGNSCEMVFQSCQTNMDSIILLAILGISYFQFQSLCDQITRVIFIVENHNIPIFLKRYYLNLVGKDMILADTDIQTHGHMRACIDR